MKNIFLFLMFIFLPGCVGIPKGISPVKGFELQRYLGTWYEIVRLDHSFEKDLDSVSAEYSIRSDGGIRVINRGFNPKTGKWKQAEGKAYSVKDPHVGRLKVSFFGPFYGAYNIIDLDQDQYSYAMVCGPNRSYFWLLARRPDMPESLKTDLIQKAGELGFDTKKLIHVQHEAGQF
ncbi:MAG: lipocalin [Desulfobacteraceae bacterium]|nr:lipocalin [Desulfobacteraceae bacterium]